MLVTQSLPEDFDLEKLQDGITREQKRRLKTAAFREWQHKLNRNDTLPRGRYFIGKEAGKPVVIFDEMHNYSSQPIIR
ncbi:hypothetical protein [Vibrio sp. Hal054]|uniref:hypothetical protein n=1 Tax=Vibrio sp. Hal054 TaxID=3035158 RepID=UPI00301CA695